RGRVGDADRRSGCSVSRATGRKVDRTAPRPVLPAGRQAIGVHEQVVGPCRQRSAEDGDQGAWQTLARRHGYLRMWVAFWCACVHRVQLGLIPMLTEGSLTDCSSKAV